MPTFPPEREVDPFRISFVCTGNICRSPMAAAVLRSLVTTAGLEAHVTVDSAATGDWHVGEQADQRTLAALARLGYDGSGHRARQFEQREFGQLDLIIALDRTHQRVLRSWAGTDADRSKIHLLLAFDPEQMGSGDVPDPYYANDAMFDTVLGMIERSCQALFRQIEPAIRQGARTP